MRLTRREFFYSALSTLAGCAQPPSREQDSGAAQPAPPVIDFHVHLFGVGDGGTGAFLSDTMRGDWTYPFFLKLLGLREGTIDTDYVSALVRQLRSSSTAKAVLLAHDGRYDEAGRYDSVHTNVYVPNNYVFRVASEHKDLFIPGSSINPKRRDALDELERCAEAGARVLKIHPPVQDVDPADKRFRPFYRCLAEHRIILMVHTGMEPAPGIVGHIFSDPARLTAALEEGCTVIAAHAGLGGTFDKGRDYSHFLPNLVTLVRRFPNLYCDTAFIASMFWWRAFPRLLEESTARRRILYGSDWPWPSNPLVFWDRLTPTTLLSLCSERNLFERDLQLKRALGLPADAFRRGAELIGLPEGS